MGANLEEFIVRVKFDKAGQPSEVIYWDQEGCGHEQRVDIQARVINLVDYHLSHYRKSHRMTPKSRCGFTVEADHLKFECHLEPHGPGIKHKLEQH